MADKIFEFLKLIEKFGVKPGKIIGAGDRKVVPIKKPILSKTLNRWIFYFRIKDSYDFGDSFQLGLWKLLSIEKSLITLVRLHYIVHKL